MNSQLRHASFLAEHKTQKKETAWPTLGCRGSAHLQGGINGVGTKSNPIELKEVAIGSKGLPVEKPTPELIQIPQGGNVSAVDNASDVRGQDLGKKFENEQAIAKQQAEAKFSLFLENARLDQPIWGADKDGHFYSTSIRGMQEAERQENEQFGEMVRNGGAGVGIGYAIGGKKGAQWGYVFDQVGMSFSGVGTPYGKTEPTKVAEVPFVPKVENPINKARFSNAEVRNWYDIKVNSLNTNLPFTEENAKLLNQQRNDLKIEARSMMLDRLEAAKLDITDPIRPFEYYANKYSNQGYSGESLWQRIIQGSTTPNKNVNSINGIKNYFYGKQ